MPLEETISNFASLSGDAISIAQRKPGEEKSRLVWINDAHCRLFGYDRREVLGATVDRLHAPDHYDAFMAELAPAIARREQYVFSETLCRKKDGTTFWTSMSMFFVDDPNSDGWLSTAIHRDVSELKAREASAEAALAERDRLLSDVQGTKTRLLAAMNAVSGPLAIWDKDYELVVCNDAFAPRLLGRPKNPEPGVGLKDVLREAAHSGQFADDIDDVETWLDYAVAELKAGPVRHRTVYTDGRVFRTSSHRADNGDTLVLSVDITDLEEQHAKVDETARKLKQANDVARHQALHDDLTGLGNRRFLKERLAKIQESHRDSDADLAALQIDLDRFKTINDTMGHAVGDLVLKVAAERLRKTVRADDVLARMGGDEFVVLITCSPRDEWPERLARRIVQRLSEPVSCDGKTLQLGASIGVARSPLSRGDDLLGNADVALYKAKSWGRSRFCSFDPSDRAELERRKALSDDILVAIENDEFVPYFQPQIDLETNRVVALETLVRWRHPRAGLLEPSAFLEVAEDLNVLGNMDARIFDIALDQCIRAFPDGDGPGVSFNVSDTYVMSDGVLQTAAHSSDYSGGISFEFLETIFFEEETDAFLMRVDALREAGVSIELDDFGSGRSSIVALQRISPDRLKIDRRLVGPIAQSDQSRKLVEFIVEIGRTLGVGVTAEGVASNDHAAILAEIGCDRGQGFHYARPMPLADICRAFRIGRDDRLSA